MNEWSDPVLYGRADEVSVSDVTELSRRRGRHLRRVARDAAQPVSRIARGAGGRRGRSAWSSSLRTGELGPKRNADQLARKRRPAA